MVAIGHAVGSVLEDSDVVGQALQVIEFQFGQHGRQGAQRARLVGGTLLDPPMIATLHEEVKVASGDLFPCVASSEIVGAPPDCQSLVLVREQVGDLGRQCPGIVERHESTATVLQHFLCVPVWRGHDRVAGGHGVRKRSGRDLGHVQVGGAIHISRPEILAKLRKRHKLVAEDDAFIDALATCQLLQPKPVGLTLRTPDVRMGGAENDVHHVRMTLDDAWQRAEHDLYALVRR